MGISNGEKRERNGSDISNNDWEFPQINIRYQNHRFRKLREHQAG